MKIQIKGGRVLDPASGLDEIIDLWIKDNRIVQRGGDAPWDPDQVILAEGCYVMPGLIDLHVHFREPGFEYKETLKTGSRAAARGGFTAVCPMANTNPVIDTAEKISWILEKAKTDSVVRILPIGAVTMGMEGKEITDMEGMKKAGAVAFSEDGKTVMNAAVYRRGLLEAARLNLPVLDHCEDANLLQEARLYRGSQEEARTVSRVSHACEDLITARDLLLAEETGVRLHLCHCSTAASVNMLAQAKERGVLVSAEVCPHHFTLTYQDMPQGDTNYKMAPPLREKEDVQAMREALSIGIIDAIATDHAPHSKEEKDVEFFKAPNGIVGAETAVSLTITELVEKGILTPLQMAERMSYIPAKILGLPLGELCQGGVADITIIDPREEYIIDKKDFVSKGENTPFHGRKVRGRVKYTIVNGKMVYAWEEKV